MTEGTIRVLVVDDHEMVRFGLVSYLGTQVGISVVGEAADGAEAVEMAMKLCPDVVLMDLVMEGTDGIEATRSILQHCPETKVIALTSFSEDELVYPIMEAGAVGYLLKTATAEEITEAITSAAAGQMVLDQRIAKKLIPRRRTEPPLYNYLTEREMDVLLKIADGKNNQEIADGLHISVKTVKTHVSSILSKLQLNDRTQAAVYAHRHRLASDD